MDKFLNYQDTLSERIENQCNILFKKLQSLDLTNLKIRPHDISYLKDRHLDRLFFSIQSSAELLYRSIKLCNRPVEEITLMDYGAGAGTSFVLAKMIGLKCVIYNDFQDLVTKSAEIYAEALDVHLDLYMPGNYPEVYRLLKEKGISCDIIISRNVLEHIYDLDDYYEQTKEFQPKAVLYFSTTANYHNPLNRVYHERIHKKKEIVNLAKRVTIIKETYPDLAADKVQKLAQATRGLAMDDLKTAMQKFVSNGTLPHVDYLYTNTVDPSNGVWEEHLIKKEDYFRIIKPFGYKVSVLPAFWDTHYKKGYMNLAGKAFNSVTDVLGKDKGLWTTAFIYVIAVPE